MGVLGFRFLDPWEPCGAQEVKRAVVTREKGGKAVPTSALAEAVTAAQVAVYYYEYIIYIISLNMLN